MQKWHKMRWSQLRLMSVSWIHIGIWWQMLGETLDWEVIVVRLGPLFGEWNSFPLDKGINALTFTHSTTIYTWKMLNRWLAYIAQNIVHWEPFSISGTWLVSHICLSYSTNDPGWVQQLLSAAARSELQPPPRRPWTIWKVLLLWWRFSFTLEINPDHGSIFGKDSYHQLVNRIFVKCDPNTSLFTG